VCEDPIKLFAVPERVLNEVHVGSDPDVYAFFLDEFAAQGVFLQVCAFEICAVAGIS
jgi:hypothetical protein